MGEYRMAWASSNRKQANWKGVRPLWIAYDNMWGQKIKLINIMKHLINQRVKIQKKMGDETGSDYVQAEGILKAKCKFKFIKL